MVKTNLILIDGVPGSGKSATAQALWLHLRRNDYDATWFFEHQSSHPIYRLDDLGKIYRTSVDQIESCTGYDFFSAVSPSIQSVIESKVDNQ